MIVLGFSMDNLEKFVNDLLAGNLEPYMKSEAVPDNSNNAVKVGNGNTRMNVENL